MTTHSPHRQDIALVLPIGPNGTHRLRSGPEGTLPPALVPAEAVNWLTELRRGGKNITSIDLCGPGDVLASWDGTRACLELLQGKVEEAVLMVTTLGLGGAERVPDLARLGVGQINLLVHTVQAATAAKLFDWIRPGKRTMVLSQGCEVLLGEQAEFCKACVAAGLKVNIRTILVQGVNDGEVADIARTMADLGATSMEIGGENMELLPLVKEAEAFLPTSLYEPEPPLPPPGMPQPCAATANLPKPTRERGHVAVASGSGMEVDMHLGQADQLLIYGQREDGLTCLLETRRTPPAGAPDRWQALAKVLPDCFCLLASHAGEVPRGELAQAGIKVLLTTDEIEGLVDTLYGGGKKKKCKKG